MIWVLLEWQLLLYLLWLRDSLGLVCILQTFPWDLAEAIFRKILGLMLVWHNVCSLVPITALGISICYIRS